MDLQITEYPEILGGAPDSKQSLRLWLRLLSCTTLIENTIRNKLRENYQTTLPRFDVMAALHRNPDGLTMGALSRYLMVSNGNITGVVSRLESDGLVLRQRSKEDKRSHYVRLTREGLSEFKRMASTHETWIDAMFADIPREKADQLLDDLRRVQDSVMKHHRRRTYS